MLKLKKNKNIFKKIKFMKKHEKPFMENLNLNSLDFLNNFIIVFELIKNSEKFKN